MAQFKAQMLWESIKKGDLTAVHGLLESGNINLEERDETGRTFLMVASEKGELNIVRELLAAGVDPNAVDNESWSALLCASKEGYLEIVIELLEHGAELEHKDMCGWTSLMWASYKGRITVVQELLDRGAHASAKADHHMTSLAWAAGRGHTEIVQMLVNKGAKVNTADKYGTTPLIWACRKGYIEIVDSLLAEGAHVDASGMHSWTPLLVATKGGHAEVVNSLLQHDPNVNATDKDGQTSLAIAAREGHVDIVKDLLSKGAYVNVPDRRVGGDSILIHAVKGGQLEVVKALLDKYVDVDVQGAEGKTALYWAVEKGYNETVKLLLASEPDLEICTKDDDTALLRAVRSRNEECVRMLLEKGAKVSATDKRGDTALHIAIRARSKRITELLLRNPRNSRLLYRPNKSGETPYAMDTYHQRGILQGIYGHRNLNASDAENLLGYDIYSSALADILSDPSLSTPITVGLYAKWGSGKSFLISKLQSEMKSFTQQNEEERFSLTLTLVLLMLFLSLVVGEALVLGVSLKVGLGVAAAIFLMQLIFCGAVMLCDRRYDMKYAVRISVVLGRRQRMMMLLLRMLFCNPQRSIKADRQSSNQYSVSVAGEKALAAMIATLCQAVEREYGFIVTRLFRVFKPADNNQKKGRFKSLCCVPYFLFVLLVLLCVAAGVALLVQFRIKQHMAVDGILIAIASILTLTLVGNIYTWAQTIMALVSSQKRRVLKAADQVDSLKMDGFLQRLKQEVELMSHMVRCMDAFTADQTRLVVIVDGLDTCEQDKVLQVLDTVKSLFSDDYAPFITILAVDPHIIIKGIEHNLKSTFQDSNVNGFDYLRNVVHLPFYLQTQGLRIQHQESIHDDRERTAPKLGHQESTTSVESKREARRKGREGLSGSQPQMFSSSFDLSNTFARSDYFSDINPRSMRRLMNIVSVTARLLRAYNIDFKWHRLAAWINIIEQWPYRVSWIIYLFEEQDVVESSVSLYTLYQRILPRIPMTKESEPLLEIDRNARKLEAFLSSQSASLPRLNVADLRKFLPCTINLDPYLRKLIRETEHQNELRQESSLMGGIYPGSQAYPPAPPVPLPSSGPSFPDNMSLGSWIRPPSQGSSPSRYLSPQAPVVTVQNPSVSGSMGMVPAGSSFTFPRQGMPGSPPSRPHPAVFFSDSQLLPQWAELDVDGVCDLLGALKGVTPETLASYARRARENNISGLVLQNCELDELRPVLEMRFGDWQLFKAAILALRDWENCSLADDFSRNASHSSTSTSLPTTSSASPGGQGKDVGSDGRQTLGGKAVQGRVVGPKGRRMRRNDSIVQQLSYEAAILHEALEEFSEEESDREGGEEVVVVEDLQGDRCAQSPLTGAQVKDEASVIANLSSLITVLDAPSHSGSGEEAAQAPPYLLQSSFPSNAQFSEVVRLVSSDPQEEEQQDLAPSHSHKHHHHRPLLKSLSTGLEKIARPFIHAFDSSHAAEGQLGSEESVGGGADRLALLSSSSGRETTAAVHRTPVSAWDRRTFSQDSSSSSEARDRPVSIEMAPPSSSRPVFSVGSEENSPTQPDFRVEREVTSSTHMERGGSAPSARSSAQSSQQQSQSGPWQHRAQVAPDDLLYRKAGPSPDKDKESFV